jgi:monoamine oxidase
MHDVIIVGSGLSGLVAAQQLQQFGKKILVLEAQSNIGGRIQTYTGINGTPMEMGATWLGNKHTFLRQLLKQSGIALFEQWQGGNAIIEAQGVMEQYAMPPAEPYYRIAGGSSSIIQYLAKTIGPATIHTNAAVTAIELKDNYVQVMCSNGNSYNSTSVILAIPPQVAAKTITFQPSLPNQLLQVMQQTQTWMAGSIKFALAYTAPFWKQAFNISTIYSDKGPATEMYDHTDAAEQHFALKGFLLPQLSKATPLQRKEWVAQQVQRYFGTMANTFIQYTDYVWCNNWVGCGEEQNHLLPHQNNGHYLYTNSYMNERLFWAGTETAQQFGGYMDGAVEAGLRAARAILQMPIH